MRTSRLSRRTNQLQQTSVLWRVSGLTGAGGRTFADPIELAPPSGVRWRDKVSLYIDASGQQRQSLAVVRVAPDLPILVGDYIFEGPMAALTAEELADPLLCGTAYEVKMIKTTPDLRGEHASMTVWV